MILFATILILVLIFYQIYVSLTKKHDYWKKKNVPHLKPKLLFGNFKEYILFKKSNVSVTSEICDKFPDEPYVGVFYGTAPALVVKDPKILKLVLTQDFFYFNGRENTDYAYKEPITMNLFSNGGDHWKVLRQNLTPLFTSAKLKNMFPMINECAEEMDLFLKEELQISDNINIKSLFARYSMECIIKSVFGLRANTMKRDNGQNPFVIIGEEIVNTSVKAGLKNIGRAMWPEIFYALGFQLFDERVEVFFNNLFTGARKNRPADPSTRQDFVDLVLSWDRQKYISGDSFSNNESNEKKIEKIEVNEDLLVAQCTLFFAAGFETTSSTTNYLLYELAKSKQAQDRVLEEVDAYFNKHGVIKYDCLSEMPYVEACIEETLRLYPVLPIITREVMSSYTFPTGLQLQKGDRLHVPIHYIHHHPDNFEDPALYRPERFFGDERKKIKQCTYLPFGEGPRVCIGIRFARMVMYAGLLTIFRKYRVELGENMPLSLKFKPVSPILQATINMYIKFIPREA